MSIVLRLPSPKLAEGISGIGHTWVYNYQLKVSALFNLTVASYFLQMNLLSLHKRRRRHHDFLRKHCTFMIDFDQLEGEWQRA